MTRMPEHAVAPLIDGLDALRVGLALFDRHDVLVYCNEHFRYVYRSLDSVESVIGMRFEDIERRKIADAELAGRRVLEDPKGYLAERLARRMRREFAPFEERLSDGRWIQVKERPLPDGGVIALFQDVSALKTVEVRLLDALDSMPDASLFWDQRGRLVHVNEQLGRLVNEIDRQALVGCDFEGVISHLKGQAVFQVAGDDRDWFDAWRGIRRTAGGTVILRAMEDRWFSLTERRARDGGTITVFSDVTEIKRREAELLRRGESLEHAVNDLEMVQSKLEDQGALLAEQVEEIDLARREAARANDGKVRFLRAISHELRSPLNAIIGFADLIQGEPYGPLGSPRYGEYIGDIHASGKHLLALVNQLLDLSRMEAGHHKLDLGRHDFRDIYDSAWQIVAGLLQGKDIAYEAEFVDPLPELHADAQAIRQVLVNLLSNAIKFTPEGGTIRLRARRDGADLLVSVADSGIGIPPQVIPRLMRPFERAQDAENRQIQGTGLGLAISRTLAELHGGGIAIESQLGAGTTFTLRVPVGGPERVPGQVRAGRRLAG